MGGEIAQVIASAGIPVVLKDVKQEFVELGLKKAREVTAAQLANLVHKQKITQEQADAQAAEILGRIHGTTEYEGFGDVDFVIEAVPERMAIKQAVFAELDALTPGHAILASNTSSLPISEMADATSRPDKVVGFHFFYPASFMRLVEVVEGADTSPETMQTATTFAQAIRKMPIACGEEPGFVVNRILNSAISEVWRFQEANEPVDQGDRRRRLGLARRADGPVLPHRPARPRHGAARRRAPAGVLRPGVLLRPPGHEALVAAGELGAKTGKGFYDNGEPRSDGETEFDHDELTQRFVLKAFVEACLVLEDGMATVRDIDLGMMAGAGPHPAAVRARRPDRPRCRARRARARHGRVGRAVRAAADPAPARRAGPPRREVRPGLLRLQAARRRLRAGRGRAARDARRLRDRLAGPPAGELAGAAGHRGARRASGSTSTPTTSIRALIIASANPMLWCAGADIKAFTKLDAQTGAKLLDDDARAAAPDGVLRDDHDRRGQRRRLRRRLRAGDGLRRADRRAVGELRPARGQPRHHPRLRRHAAPAAARRHGAGAGAQPHRRSDLRRRGLRDRPRQPRRARPRAARRGARVGAQARRPGAAGGRRRSSARRPATPTSTRASRPRRPPSARSSPAPTRARGSRAFLGKRTPQWSGT